VGIGSSTFCHNHNSWWNLGCSSKTACRMAVCMSAYQHSMMFTWTVCMADSARRCWVCHGGAVCGFKHPDAISVVKVRRGHVCSKPCACVVLSRM
jgi:hypothetical protein